MWADFDAIKDFLTHSYRTGDVYEVRVLMQYSNRCAVGYFNDHTKAANAVQTFDHAGIAGFYTTINTVSPDLLARVNNRIVDAKAGSYTKDTEVPHRSCVFLDIDPDRDSGISATDEEHQKALIRAGEVDAFLQQFCLFPPACIIDSGNGAHLRWHTEFMDNTVENTDLIKRFLRHTKKIFEGDGLEFDAGNFNPARIARLPGTVARKGENLEGFRPHRMARVLRHCDPLAPALTRDAILALAPELTAEAAAARATVRRGLIADGTDSLYRRLSSHAQRNIDDWVPYILGNVAYRSGEGYRIKQKSIGQKYQEDIAITPICIKNHGVADQGDKTEGLRTPVQLVAEIVTDGDRAKAANLLSMVLNYPLTEFEDKPIQAGSGDMPPELLGTAPPAFHSLSELVSHDLATAEYEPQDWHIDALIPQRQYVMLHAAPKAGKSTMARQMTVATVTGLPFMDREVVQGEVLYISYEEAEGPWRDGIKAAYDWMKRQDDGAPPNEVEYAAMFAKIHLIINRSKRKGLYNKDARSFPRGVEGIKAIQDYIDARPAIKMVVLDPYESIFDETMTRDIKKQHRLEGELIKTLYENNNVCVIVVDHSKKEVARSEPHSIDVLNSTSGTAQKPATADMLIAINALPTLAKDDPVSGMPKGTKLAYIRVTGRYTPEVTIKANFEAPLGWRELADDIPFPTLREVTDQFTSRGAAPIDPLLKDKIITVLTKEGSTDVTTLSEILNASYQRVRRTLIDLVGDGIVLVDKTFRAHKYSARFDGGQLQDIL